jgi:guanylate kinase
MTPKHPIIAVVGNCASGKTTLVTNLKNLGHNGINVPQEHSEIRRLWRHKKPNLLVLLSCTHATAKSRRPGLAWTEKQLEVQRRRLHQAREECDLYIVTDPLTQDEVVGEVLALIQKQAKETGK